MRVLALCRRDFTSPRDFKSISIKAVDSETKEGLRIEEATEESLGCAALAFLRRYGKEVSHSGLRRLTKK